MSAINVDYHIIILGGGVVGLALANKLAPLGLKIAVLEKNTLNLSAFFPEQYDLRVMAINRGSQQLLQEINVWPEICARRVSPYYKMKVWAPHGEIQFDCDDILQPNLGHIIEQCVLMQALLGGLTSWPNVDLISPMSVASVEMFEDYGQLRGERNFSFQLLVGADGQASWLRQYCGIEVVVKDYEHHALVTHVQCEKKHDGTAYQVFLPTGPLAFLPLAHERECSIVWSTTPLAAADLKQAPEADFVSALSSRFPQLGQLKLIAPRVSFPLKMQHAKNYVQKRVALIGDAAHTVHPLAGLGINLGLQDVTALSNCVVKAYQANRDFGLLKTLRSYELERKSENSIMLNAISGFKEWASSMLFGLGLNIVNKQSWLKEIFIKKALGV